MKRNLFYLFVLICSTSLFIACSEEDNSWKQLPEGEITPEKTELKLNGVVTTGTITFKALSPATAQLDIKNVIDGYSDVAVDITMEKQADESFILKGTKEITTKPVTKATGIPAPFLTVTVEGTITKDGVLTVNILAAGPGLYIGTYSGETLDLSYGENILAGKEVVFDATDGSKASLLLKDVIPGQSETTIEAVQVTNDGFSGTATTTTAEVKYTGSLKDKVLKLKLDVTMKDPSKWAKSYGLGAYTAGSYDYLGTPLENFPLTSPLYSNWKAEDDYSAIWSGVFKTAGGALLPQVLKTVSLEPNGNVSAEYSSGSIVFDQMWIMGIMFGQGTPAEEFTKLIPVSGWKPSPKGLAFWYEKDGKLYIKLNIAAIIAQEMGSNSDVLSGMIAEVLKGDAASIKNLLNSMLKVDLSKVTDATFNKLLSWVNNGFPMTVKKENGHTYIALNKEEFDPIFMPRAALDENGEPIVDEDWGIPVMTSDIQELCNVLVKANILPAEMAPIVPLLTSVCATYAGTTEFDLGLDLQ